MSLAELYSSMSIQSRVNVVVEAESGVNMEEEGENSKGETNSCPCHPQVRVACVALSNPNLLGEVRVI